MPYNFVAHIIHTKKLCDRLSVHFLQVKCNFSRKTAVLLFSAPLGIYRKRTIFVLGSLEGWLEKYLGYNNENQGYDKYHYDIRC